MLTPQELKKSLPVSDRAARTVEQTRDAIRRILAREDHRLLVVMGPCSIHDTNAALEYGARVAALGRLLADDLLIVMRTYFEKPRTTVGWRGLVADPFMDGSADVNAGLRSARELLLELNGTGVPCATESLDPMLVGYTDDLVSWTALGARTCESQIHRAMASGLPMPVGLKNGTDGRVEVAVDAVETVAAAQSYLGLDPQGRIGLQHATGNDLGHVVLRGGYGGPNFDATSVRQCQALLEERGLRPNIAIDCSHANSQKEAKRQLDVLDDVSTQIFGGNHSIIGIMLESHLFEGSQAAVGPVADLRYGVSVTDECLGWEDTAQALIRLRDETAGVLPGRSRAPHIVGTSYATISEPAVA